MRDLPKIKFIYSLPYDRLLTEYEGRSFNEKQVKEVKNFIQKLQPKWNKIEELVFLTLEKVTKNIWPKKEIKCCVVKYCKYTGISNPLTIKIDTDLDFVISTLIHELVHISVSFYPQKYKKIERKLKKQFPGENRKTILHIYINFIEFQVIKKLFNKRFITKVLEREKSFKGIKKAWKIVLNRNTKKFFQMNLL